MEKNRKKELLSQWKERHPEMGVVSITCKATGDMFFDVSRDTSRGFNIHRFQLSGNLHRNKQLQALWNAYGEAGFDYAVVSTLEYKNLEDVGPGDLKELLDICLMEYPQAKKL